MAPSDMWPVVKRALRTSRYKGISPSGRFKLSRVLKTCQVTRSFLKSFLSIVFIIIVDSPDGSADVSASDMQLGMSQKKYLHGSFIVLRVPGVPRQGAEFKLDAGHFCKNGCTARPIRKMARPCLEVDIRVGKASRGIEGLSTIEKDSGQGPTT